MYEADTLRMLRDDAMRVIDYCTQLVTTDESMRGRHCKRFSGLPGLVESERAHHFRLRRGGGSGAT